jgi:hypothetical protein
VISPTIGLNNRCLSKRHLFAHHWSGFYRLRAADADRELEVISGDFGFAKLL